MNPPPPPQGGYPNAMSEELKKYLLSKHGKGPLFAFLFSSATVFLVLLVTVLKPNRFYKKFLDYIFSIKITISGNPYKLHHFLLLVALVYGALFFFLIMQGRQNYPNPLDPYRIKMEKLDKKWINESQSWLAFLIVICVLSIYRNTKLFNSEAYLLKKIDEYNKELDKNKTKKTE